MISTIFLGNNWPQLKILAEISDVKAIYVRDDTSENVQMIKYIAKKNNIPLYTPKTMRKDKDPSAFDNITGINPDIIVSGGYHLVVPEEIINSSKIATVNIHPALLPKYRGQHVIQWQIINNEKITGTTLHMMTKDLDKGDIISQAECDIDFEDTALDIWKKTSDLGSDLLHNFIKDVESGKGFEAKKQNDDEATYFRARVPEDGIIDWTRKSIDVHNLVRALAPPWPGAFFVYNGKNYIVDKVEIIDGKTDAKPGKIISSDDESITVSTSDGNVMIKREYFRPALEKIYFKEGDMLDEGTDIIHSFVSDNRRVAFRKYSENLTRSLVKDLESFEKQVFSGLHAIWNEENYLYKMPNKENLSFYAFVDDKFAGLIIGSSYDSIAHINRIGVLQEYQGHGIGKKLVALFEEHAKKHGFKMITLSRLSDEKKLSATFFKDLGFISLDSRDEIIRFLDKKSKSSEIDRFYPPDKPGNLVILQKKI